MLSYVLSRLIILVVGVMYPAYSSFKAVKSRNMKAYVKWMIYWIVYACFSAVETVADMFVTWIPFYYEMKIILVLWLVSPATRGSLIVFKKFMRPVLETREQEIDAYIETVGAKGYGILRQLGANAVSFAFTSLWKGHLVVMEHVKKSFLQVDIQSGGVPAISSHGDDVDANAVISSPSDATPAPSSQPAANKPVNSGGELTDRMQTTRQGHSQSALLAQKPDEYQLTGAATSTGTKTTIGSRTTYASGSQGVSSYYERYARHSTLSGTSSSSGLYSTGSSSSVDPAGSYYDRYVRQRPTSSYAHSTSSTQSSSSSYGSTYLRR